MRFFALLLAIMISFVLVSCTNHNNDYLKEDQQISPLVVPPGVPPIKQQTYYPVPKTTQIPTQKPVKLKPPTLKQITS